MPSSTLFLLKLDEEYAAGIFHGMISCFASASVPVLWHVSIGMYVSTSEMGRDVDKLTQKQVVNAAQ